MRKLILNVAYFVESDNDCQFDRECGTATITGIYMNQSSGLSHILDAYFNKGQTTAVKTEATRNWAVKNEPVSDECDGISSSDDSMNSDINDLDYLPEEELELLKNKPPPKKKKVCY